MKMRGLPFSAGDKDIEDFLHPLQPTSIEVIYDSYGRHSGEAVVTLDSQQSVDEAVKKDKQYMGRHACVCMYVCACAHARVCVHACTLGSWVSVPSTHICCR